MKDLLKEAIADAKAVKQTALANAKIALEEAFTPRLQSMLSAKLAEEMSDDDDEDTGEEVGTSVGETQPQAQTQPAAKPAAGAPAPEAQTEPAADDDVKEEGQEFGEEDGGEHPQDTEGAEHYEGGDEDDDLDLDEIIKELEMDSTDIGAGNNEMEEEKPAHDNQDDDNYVGESEMAPEAKEGDPDQGDEDIDINEIIRSLKEDDEEGKEEDKTDDKEDLEEAYNVIRFLKGKINEVNLLNAKLLYSNKLFRNFSLNEGQKMKVIENFDRAHNLREVKLVYSTLAEGFKMPSTKKMVKESFASKPVASTKPANKQVISEGADLAARFKKLAGLNKKK